METVLLTGGRSFIGGHVCRVLIQRGYNVIVHSTRTAPFENLSDLLPHPQVKTAACSYQDKAQLAALMSQAQYLIFAAVPPSLQTLGQEKAKERDALDLKSILDTLAASAIKKSVFISTCSTIPKAENGLADESGPASKDHGWLGISFKFKLETMVMDYVKKGVQIVIVNPTMFIGEYDTKPSSGEFFRFFDKFPLYVLKNAKINIIDVADAAKGTVMALEKGRPGERYLLGGKNIVVKELVDRIKNAGGNNLPKLAIPYFLTLAMSVISELVNMVVRKNKPLVALIGIELTVHGNQHYSCEKAQKELGYVPGETWPAVDRAYSWYKSHGILTK